MEQVDAARVFKQVSGQITTALSGVEADDYSDKRQRTVIAHLKQLVVDVRLDIRDVDMSDTRQEMQGHSKAAVRRLAELHKDVLSAAEFDVFNPVDVAQISAQIEQITVALES